MKSARRLDPSDRAWVTAAISRAARVPLADAWKVAPALPGVYVLRLEGKLRPVYVGAAQGSEGLRGRLREHARQWEGYRARAPLDRMTAQWLAVARRAVLRTEAAVKEDLRPVVAHLAGCAHGYVLVGQCSVCKWW